MFTQAVNRLSHKSNSWNGNICSHRDDRVTYLFDVGDVSNSKGDGINVKLVIIKGKLLCISHHPRQT